MDYMLEVEKFGKIVSHYLTELDIKLHDKYENRIILIYNVLEHDYLIFLQELKENNVEVFEAEDREKILQVFKEFRCEAVERENSNPIRSSRKKKEELHSALETFFGN